MERPKSFLTSVMDPVGVCGGDVTKFVSTVVLIVHYFFNTSNNAVL